MTGKDLQSRVEINPKVMLGKPVIRDTRITVEIILEKLAADFPIEEILTDFPQLSREDVLAALHYARQAIGTDELEPHLAGERTVRRDDLAGPATRERRRGILEGEDQAEGGEQAHGD